MVAGGLSTLITAPMDMVKTRLMLQRESKRVGTYKNGFHCAYQVVVFISCSFFHCTFFFFFVGVSFVLGCFSTFFEPW